MHDATDPLPPATPEPPSDGPAPVPGRGQRFGEIGLRRLRTSWILRISAIAAFLGYGGLVALLLAGKIPFGLGGTVALLSLASWFFLFWWYPVLERTRTLDDDPRRQAIGTVLETIAIGCVVLVHVLMAVIVVIAART